MELLGLVPVGQYVSGTSWLHRTDPRSKVLLGLALTFLLFFWQQPYALFWLGLWVLLAGVLSGFRLGYLLLSFQAVLPVALLTMLFHALWGEAPTALAGWLSLPGLERGGLFAFRMLVLVLFAQLLTLTTAPVRLCEGLESLMTPLKWIGVPVHDLALAASISLRFLPILGQEMEKLVKAQVSRGACLDQGPWRRRLPALLSILVPLFVRAFRYADDLAQAMEARGYQGGAPRTRLYPLRLGLLDLAVVTGTLGLWALPLLWGGR